MTDESIFRNMMKLGSSTAWPEVLKEFTGETDRIDPQAILDYFEPLYNWLLKQNLTDIDWDCESYIDKIRNVVLPYGSKLSSKASSIFSVGSNSLVVITVSLLASFSVHLMTKF